MRERPARVAQNPRTLEKVPVPAKHVVRFKAGRVMRERVCEEIVAGSDGATKARTDSSNGRAGAAANGAAHDGVHLNGAGDHARDGAEGEKGKPAPPTPPPATPGSPF